MRVANRNLMRAINQDNVLRTIRQHGTVSRKNISMHTGLSQSTITDITAELLKTGLIFEKTQQGTRAGRPSKLLALNPDGVFVAGAYVAAQKISVVVINLEARVMGSHALPFDKSVITPEQVADHVAEAVRTCCQKHGFIPADISGLGLGLPGLVNAAKGVMSFHPGFNPDIDWANVPFQAVMEEKTGFPTFIENSSNTLALFEHWFGAAQGMDDFIVVTLEHGVGMGFFVNGAPARGWQGTAGEFGHVRGDEDEAVCRCGMKGCLEAVASPHAILRDARVAAKNGEWIHPPNEITLERVIQAAENGDSCLQGIFTHAGKILGRRIADISRVLDPETIIITGKTNLAKAVLFDPLFREMEACTPEVFGQRPKLVIRPWHEENYARGAGALALQKLFQSSSLLPA